MNIRCLLAIVALSLCCACDPPTTLAMPKLSDCPAGSVVASEIRINLSDVVDINPPHACVARGKPIMINIDSPEGVDVKKGTVAILPNSQHDFWLTGSNARKSKRFVLFVGRWVAETPDADPYEYSAFVDGMPATAARITVRDEDK